MKTTAFFDPLFWTPGTAHYDHFSRLSARQPRLSRQRSRLSRQRPRLSRRIRASKTDGQKRGCLSDFCGFKRPKWVVKKRGCQREVGPSFLGGQDSESEDENVKTEENVFSSVFLRSVFPLGRGQPRNASECTRTSPNRF